MAAILIGVVLICAFLLWIGRKSGATVILVAVAVTLATGFVSFNVIIAAGWSSIHGGLSNGAFYILFFVALVAPPALGFLAGAVIRHRLGKKLAPDTIEPA
jgi:hypothetical protein